MIKHLRNVIGVGEELSCGPELAAVEHRLADRCGLVEEVCMELGENRLELAGESRSGLRWCRTHQLGYPFGNVDDLNTDYGSLCSHRQLLLLA